MSLRCLLCFNKSMIRTSVSGNAHFGKRVSRMKLWSSQLRLLTSQSWEPVPDLDYLSDPKNYEAIESNINSRKGTGSIKVMIIFCINWFDKHISIHYFIKFFLLNLID